MAGQAKRPAKRKVPGAPAGTTTASVGRIQQTPRQQPMTHERPTIVGVGASAGGLEAFSAMLRALPPDPGIAIVFVQHLAPQHESALVSLLSSQTELPVVQATEGLRVQPNHVYVIPPNTQMIVAADHLHLSARPDDRSRYTPVDSFLTSLAQAVAQRAIGVILSGTASDGALGIREIKAAGGMTLAQDPESAKYDGMPRAAIATAWWTWFSRRRKSVSRWRSSRGTPTGRRARKVVPKPRLARNSFLSCSTSCVLQAVWTSVITSCRRSNGGCFGEWRCTV